MWSHQQLIVLFLQLFICTFLTNADDFYKLEQKAVWEDAFKICRQRDSFMIGRQAMNILAKYRNKIAAGEYWLALKRTPIGRLQWIEEIAEVLPAPLQDSLQHYNFSSEYEPWNTALDCSTVRFPEGLVKPADCLKEYTILCLPASETDITSTDLDIRLEVDISSELLPARDVKFVTDPNIHVKYLNTTLLSHQNVEVTLNCLIKDDNKLSRRYLVKDGVYLGSVTKFEVTEKGLLEGDIFDSIEPRALAAGTYWCEAWNPRQNTVKASNKVMFLPESYNSFVYTEFVDKNETLSKILNDMTNDQRKQFAQQIIKLKHLPKSWNVLAATNIRRATEIKILLFEQANPNLINVVEYAQRTTSQPLDVCTAKEVDTKKENTRRPKWPISEVGKVVASDPLCLNKNLELNSLECVPDMFSGASWISLNSGEEIGKQGKEIRCDIVQDSFETLNHCPPGFTGFDGNVCVRINENVSWLSSLTTCMKAGASRMISDIFLGVHGGTIRTRLIASGVTFVWLQSKRDFEYGPIKNKLPGSLVYARNFNWLRYNNKIRWSAGEPKGNQKCVFLNIRTLELGTSDCESKFTSVCVLEKNDIKLRSFACPSGSFTTSYHTYQNKCFSIHKATREHVKFSATSPEQVCFQYGRKPMTIKYRHESEILKLLLDRDKECDSAIIAFQKKTAGVTYGWNDAKDLDLEYVNWSPGTYYSNDQLVMFHLNESWSFANWNQSSHCYACVMDIEILLPKMEFYQSQQTNKLLLDVYNSYGLWNRQESNEPTCTLDGPVGKENSVLLEKIAEHEWSEDNLVEVEITNFNFKMQKSVYKVIVENEGYVKCFGYTIHTFANVFTSSHLHRYRQYTFALGLSYNTSFCPSNICSDIYSDNFYSFTRMEVESVFQHIDMRVDFLRITGQLSEVLYLLFRIQVSSSGSEILEKDWLSKLRDIITQFTQTNHAFSYQFLRSTVLCHRETSIAESKVLHWPNTLLGESTTSEELCVDIKGNPAVRMCEGNFNFGVHWEDHYNITCSEKVSTKTHNLYNLIVKPSNSSRRSSVSNLSTEVRSIIRGTAQTIQVTDIHFIAQSLSKIADNASILTSDHLSDIGDIMETLLKVENKVTETAQRTLNTSSVVLDSVEKIMTETELGENVSSMLIVKPRLATQLVNVKKSNIRGIALIKDSNHLEHDHLLTLKVNDSIGNILKKDPEAAFMLQNNVLDEITSNNSQVGRLVLNLYGRNTNIFPQSQRLDDGRMYNINNYVISVSLDGKHFRDLSTPVVIFFKTPERDKKLIKQCVYWDFGLNDNKGGWSQSGCSFVGTSGKLDVCACTHFTHFAQLISSMDAMNDDDISKFTLDVISIVGCSMSLLGLGGVLLTAIFIPKWRLNVGRKVQLHLCVALTVLIGVFLISGTQESTDHSLLCISLGALLHYSILASFCWMLVAAVLQLLRLVKVIGSRTNHLLLKSSVFGWGIPFIPCLVIVCINPYLYEPMDSALCYPKELAFYLSVVLPVAAIVCLNLTVFVLIIYSITCGRSRKIRSTQKRIMIHRLKMSVFLFFLLGLSWIFGLLAVGRSTIIFAYLFCATATMQGFIFFVFFVLFEKSTRESWQTMIRENGKRIKKKRSSDEKKKTKFSTILWPYGFYRVLSSTVRNKERQTAHEGTVLHIVSSEKDFCDSDS